MSSVNIRELVACALWAGHTTDDPRDVDYKWGLKAWGALIPEARKLWLANADNFIESIPKHESHYISK